MGWLVSMDPTKDRKRLVAELLEDFRRNEYPYPALLDHSQKGNTLYLLLRNPVRRVNGVRKQMYWPGDLASQEFHLIGGYRFIGIYLLAGSRNRDEGWGHKSLDESMGPNVTDCPERLLKQSQVEDRYGWREKCRQARKDANRRREWVKSLTPGTLVDLFRGYTRDEDGKTRPTYELVVFDRRYSATYFVGHFQGEKYQYRMRWADVKMPEQAAA